MDVVLFDWPFVGLALGALLLLVLIFWPRSKPGSRWRDPEWLVCLTLPVYMLHQFEEHGFDLLGRRFHFLADLCSVLGHMHFVPCPASPAFIFAVNVGGGVWIPGLIAIAMRNRNVMVGACTVGIPLVNVVAHVVPAIVWGSYNSGLFSAVLLFIPFCAWTLAQLRRAGVLDGKGLLAIVLTGVSLHAVLAASVFAHGYGLLPQQGLLAINVVDGFIPLAVGTLLFPDLQRG